ncbi:alkaline shock response membrane anchor protein AmaP, partial [Streptomyces sp. NPDC058678]
GELSRETLVHARDSAGLDRLPSKVRLREARHRAQHVA